MFLFVAFSTPCLAPIVATLSLVPGVPRTSSARRTHYPIEKIVGDSSSAKIALYYSTAACFREAIRHCCPPDMNLNGRIPERHFGRRRRADVATAVSGVGNVCEPRYL